MAMEVPSSWDALLEQARKLEAQLDDQMVAYRRIVPAKASSRADAAETDLESGINRLLKKLEHVNTQIASLGIIRLLGGGFSYFDPASRNLARPHSGKKEHASLLDDFREFDQTPLDLEDCLSSSEKSLIKERATISRSTGQMDKVISQAQATLGALVMQRSTFGHINSKISNVTSHLPMVNQLLSAIKRKKSMDNIILSLVASVCMFLILIYGLSK